MSKLVEDIRIDKCVEGSICTMSLESGHWCHSPAGYVLMIKLTFDKEPRYNDYMCTDCLERHNLKEGEQ